MNDLSYVELEDARTVHREQVATVRSAMPADDLVVEVASVFGLLGDPNRLRLVVALLEGGEMCVCDLAAVVGMSESAASHAIRWLRAHRIVSAPRRRGRMAYYRLADSHVRMLLDVTLRHGEHTTPRSPERGDADG
jgi:DNA-binding transcriptional ArsR family regulator